MNKDVSEGWVQLCTREQSTNSTSRCSICLAVGLHSQRSRRGKEDEQPHVGMKMLRRVCQTRMVSSGLVCEISRCEDGEQMLAELSLVAIHGEDHPRRRRPQLLRHLNQEVLREKCAFAITPCPTIVFLRHPIPSIPVWVKLIPFGHQEAIISPSRLPVTMLS